MPGGMADGKTVWEYLSTELSDYFYRDENYKINSTEDAKDLVS